MSMSKFFKLILFSLGIVVFFSSCKTDNKKKRESNPGEQVDPAAQSDDGTGSDVGDSGNDSTYTPPADDGSTGSNGSNGSDDTNLNDDPGDDFANWPGCGHDLFCSDGKGNYKYPHDRAKYYEFEDLSECIEEISKEGGISSRGAWYVDDTQGNFSYWGKNITIRDQRGYVVGPRLVMMRVDSYATIVNIHLEDPMSLYCIKQNSKLAGVFYSSCYPNNVAVLDGDEDSWEFNAITTPMSCYGYNPGWYGAYPTPTPYPTYP